MGFADVFTGLLMIGTTGVFTGLLPTPATVGIVDPKEVIRNDLTAWWTYALGTWLAFGLAVLSVGLTASLIAVLAVGLIVATLAILADGLSNSRATGFRGGLASIRYFALLLCTRRWSSRPLPWRLGRFLHWCYGAGLIRVAGIAYQVRHRELQDYLARSGPGPGCPGRSHIPAPTRASRDG